MTRIQLKWVFGSVAVLAAAAGGFVVHESWAQCNQEQANTPAACASNLPFCEQISGQSACQTAAGNYDIQSHPTACIGGSESDHCEIVSKRCYAVYSCVWNGGCMQGTFSHWVNADVAEDQDCP